MSLAGHLLERCPAPIFPSSAVPEERQSSMVLATRNEPLLLRVAGAHACGGVDSWR
jgi:hypothetical protein